MVQKSKWKYFPFIEFRNFGNQNRVDGNVSLFYYRLNELAPSFVHAKPFTFLCLLLHASFNSTQLQLRGAAVLLPVRGCVATRFSLIKEGVCKIDSLLANLLFRKSFKNSLISIFQTPNYGNYSIELDLIKAIVMQQVKLEWIPI